MSQISSIHLDRLPPAFIKHKVITMFEKLCLRFTYDQEVPKDTEVLIGQLTVLEKKELPNLKLVIIPHAGVNLPESTAKILTHGYPALPILTLHHNAVPTAETGVGLLLSAAKQIVRADKELRAGSWSGSSFAHSQSKGEVMMTQVVLRKKKILILGYGRIGKHVAMACKGMGMEVIGIRKRLKEQYVDDIGTTVHPLSELDSLLPSSNVLFSVLPGTPETQGLVDQRRLSLLPKEAIVVNIGRGSVFVEEDLFTALKEKVLYAAGLDVWWSYPPRNEPEKASKWAPSMYDFASLDNVVMSPHRGGGLHTPEVEEQRYFDLEEIIKDILDNGWKSLKTHANIFDPSSGY